MQRPRSNEITHQIAGPGVSTSLLLQARQSSSGAKRAAGAVVARRHLAVVGISRTTQRPERFRSSSVIV